MQLILLSAAIVISALLGFASSDSWTVRAEQSEGVVIQQNQALADSPDPTSTPFPIASPTPKIIDTLLPLLAITPTQIPSPTPSPTSSPPPPPTLIHTSVPSPPPTLTPTHTLTPTPTLTPIPTPPPVQPTATSFSDIPGLITRYANQYGVDAGHLQFIAVCESGLNPNAAFLSYVGLYQFSPGSWSNYRSQMGADTNPDLRRNPKEAIQTAAFVLSKGQSHIWPSCNP